MYEYEIKSLRVIDGDTIEAVVDLGFNIQVKEKFRLLGINTPEIRGPEREEGLKSKAQLKSIASTPGTRIRTFENRSKGKYGRWLCELWNGNLNINQWMVTNGYAKQARY